MGRDANRHKRPPAVPQWLKLDNAAKIYPAIRSDSWMAVYRLSVTLKEPVDRELLQQALDTTVDRIPFFAYRLKRGLFWYYMEGHGDRPVVAEDAVNPCSGFNLHENQHMMFRVRVWQSRIALELFHAVADGTGAMTFLLTLTAEYLRLRHGQRVPATSLILDTREAPRPEEWEDSFSVYARQASRSRKEDPAYPLRGTPAERDYLLLTTGILDTARLHQAAKRHDATINTYLAAQMLMGLADIAREDHSPRRTKRPVKLSLPVNLRRYYPSGTLRNFSSYFNVPVWPRYGDYTLEQVIALVKHFVGMETLEPMINARFSGNVHAEQSRLLRAAPLFVKTAALKLMYTLTGERYFSTVMSNLGRIDLPEQMAPHVERMDFIIGGARRNPISLGCVSAAGKTFLNFSKTIREATLEQRFFTGLVKDGVPVKVESNRRIPS